MSQSNPSFVPWISEPMQCRHPRRREKPGVLHLQQMQPRIIANHMQNVYFWQIEAKQEVTVIQQTVGANKREIKKEKLGQYL